MRPRAVAVSVVGETNAALSERQYPNQQSAVDGPYAAPGREHRRWLAEVFADLGGHVGRDAVGTVGAEGGRMAIIVVRELRKELSEDVGPDGHIRVVHAAPVDSDVSGGVGDRTFCGEPTEDMERVNYQSDLPSDPWLPIHMQTWECRACADALHTK
ncbi:hypothetical protein ACIPSE_12855 [Streptomyces sp. NPDC090106]|uniref:hypothetical protein n=1 Tax=Streptomyces sp. NPDC090106 TaxID=3365946 RepID=UPI0037FBD95D